MWFIIGLILFFITVYIHKHTYIQDWESGTLIKTATPIWAVILAFIISMIPILNIEAFIIGIIIYIANYIGEEIVFKATGIIKKLFNFLNKEI